MQKNCILSLPSSFSDILKSYFQTSLKSSGKPINTVKSWTEPSLEDGCNKAAQHLYVLQRFLRKHHWLRIDPLFAFVQLGREISCSPCHRVPGSWLVGLRPPWPYLGPPQPYLLVGPCPHLPYLLAGAGSTCLEMPSLPEPGHCTSSWASLQHVVRPTVPLNTCCFSGVFAGISLEQFGLASGIYLVTLKSWM